MKNAFLIILLGAILFFDQTCHAFASQEPAAGEDVLKIVDALVKDGKVQSSCVEAQPERTQIVKVTLVRLEKSESRQFLVEGRPPCAFGARDPMWYVYEKAAGDYKLIADLGAAASVDVSNDMTNGWKDLTCNYTYEAGTRLAANVFKFDGTVYKYSHTVEKGKAPGL
jgi:hypothetical protein